MTIAGAEVDGSVDAVACGKCGEVFIAAEEIATFEGLAVAAVIRAGWLRGGVLRAGRKVLGFPATQLASMLGVTPETISRWENDAHEVPRAVFLWLHELLVHHADRRKKHEPIESIEPVAAAPRIHIEAAA
jgi:DNA-binding transcriptional regulator YiaG